MEEPDTLSITLPPPHSTITLTPLRAAADGPAILAALNDPRVYSSLHAPDFPFTQASLDAWAAKSQRLAREGEGLNLVIRDAPAPARAPAPTSTSPSASTPPSRSPLPTTTTTTASSTPTPNARSDTASPAPFLGEIWTWKRAGDWEVGFYLAPAAHARGVMSAALAAFMSEVMIARLGARVVVGRYFASNLGSRRVFEKSGFAHMGVQGEVELSEGKTGVKGVMASVGWSRWERRAEDEKAEG